MAVQSPLSNFSDVLSQIKDSAKQYQATLTKNEAATRAVLIDPVLRALGWDTANTNMVEVEKTFGSVRADYALYDSNAIAKIIVEAKSLGTNLNQQALMMSLVQYAFQFNLNDVFLTDGLIWQHYDNFQPGNVKPTKVLDFANDDPVMCAVYLVQHLDAAKFWPVEQTIDVLSHRIDQLESLVSTLQKNIVNIPAKPSSPTQTPIPNILDNGNSQANINYIFLGKLGDLTGKRPAFLKLPDGTVLSTKKWVDVLRECCKFALANNSAIPIPFPDRAGKKVSLFSAVRPAKGISFVTEQYNGQTIFIYTNYDANNSVANAIHALQQVSGAVQRAPAAVALEQ